MFAGLSIVMFAGIVVVVGVPPPPMTTVTSKGFTIRFWATAKLAKNKIVSEMNIGTTFDFILNIEDAK